jgi:hypothetical protein
MQYLLLSHGKNGNAKAPQNYVMHTLTVLFALYCIDFHTIINKIQYQHICEYNVVSHLPLLTKYGSSSGRISKYWVANKASEPLP